MSRQDRLKDYAKPRSLAGTHDKALIQPWIDRASENSKLAPRARKGEMKLPDTEKMDLHSTSDAPRHDKDTDKRAVAKADKNFVGDSSYMAGVRRQA